MSNHSSSIVANKQEHCRRAFQGAWQTNKHSSSNRLKKNLYLGHTLLNESFGAFYTNYHFNVSMLCYSKNRLQITTPMLICSWVILLRCWPLNLDCFWFCLWKWLFTVLFLYSPVALKTFTVQVCVFACENRVTQIKLWIQCLCFAWPLWRNSQRTCTFQHTCQ